MLATFKIGGVHPPGNKLSAQEEIQELPIPEQVVVPLSQHIGLPATPLVKKDDHVLTGQLIARADGFVSANIHSPVSGKVIAIDNYSDISGFTKPAITIQVEGDQWVEDINTNKQLEYNITQSKEEILSLIAQAGIVGMGGATFPTQVKLSPPPGSKAEVLIINGVECEPYLTSDHRIMLEYTEEIIVGVQVLMKALEVNYAIIGIENNKKDAINKLMHLTNKKLGIDILPLKVKYPQGGEKQLIKAAVNRSVPSGGLPISVGAVVQNIGTALAIYDAVMKHKPLIERVVTITGKSVKKPGNYRCRIGTPITKLIEAAGGLPDDTTKIISGGPMMGRAVVNIDAPITKGTSGVLILSGQEGYRSKQQTCIRCAKCVAACPMGLEPYLLKTLAERNILEQCEHNKIMDCIECGSCSYTCPAHLPLLDYIRLGKARTGAMIRNRKK